MNAIRRIAYGALIVLPSFGLDTSAGHAETYPANVIRIVVPTGPGTRPTLSVASSRPSCLKAKAGVWSLRTDQARFKPSAWRRC